ncbi:Protein MM3350-like domain protein [Acididesulfobacillus acetoxydans]|uniref:Plasmid pRiA4b ORF-3 protein n=1 Tax=Acididesulfobacillus acetoxydans TaxID=1561005 RepID=A0A8S0W806_9FIRM|nr:plasmid pRiA4b ORF-3 family protein [Acididesulfobacillus acetoxydans]CAA7601349.1 Protein MM3350-like domain protein [Acididesulfobacillus acetoxydans]CEJ07176.1 Plasmid pRiA4b ORF-3 protein [Acididesulfobacillus acetoxydans]
MLKVRRTLVRRTKKFQEGTYLIKVSWRKGVWRKIELAAHHTLEDLHQAIQQVFDFDDDHLYSFFMDNKKWSHASYSSPLDESGPHADQVTLGELALEPGQSFLYLFDYGDEWEFKLKVEGIDPAKPLPLKPRLVAERGAAPEQYPDNEDWDE